MPSTSTEGTRAIQWLFDSDEPWTRYRTLVDLLDKSPDDALVVEARMEMLAHPQVQTLLVAAESWPGYALKRHNDAKHPIYCFSTLADFGVRHDDPGMYTALERSWTINRPKELFRPNCVYTNALAVWMANSGHGWLVMPPR